MSAQRFRLAVPIALALAALVPLPASASEGPLRAGEPVPFATQSPHPVPPGGAGEPVWSVAIEHPGATYIAVHFDRFELGPAERAVVRDPEGLQHHVFTGRGKGELGTFWATHVKGSRAVIELFGAADPRIPGWGMSIDRYAAGFLDLGAAGAPGTEAICGPIDLLNAVCFASSEPEIYDRSRAVARLLVNGIGICTGWLVGCEGHLLTNNHCIDDPNLGVDPATAAINTDYEFLAEAEACGTQNCQLCHPGEIWSGDATLLRRDRPLDYAFIHLTGDPQLTYGSFLLDDRPAVVGERIYIPQHPEGRAKELGIFSTHPSDTSGYCEVHSLDESPCLFNGPLDVGYFCDTEGGASGSPVVAWVNHQVIALHHCAICPNRGVPITAVIDHLGADLPACAMQPAPNLVHGSHAVDDSGGTGDGFADPGESVSLVVTLRNIGSGAATAVTATISAPSGGAFFPVAQASWPSIPKGASAASLAPHFQMKVGAGVSCGEEIDLQLDVTTAEGAYRTSFRQRVGANVAPGTKQNGTGTPIPIPDNDPAGVASTVEIPLDLPVGDVTVAVDITHSFLSDLQVALTSPAGTTVWLHNRSGSGIQDLATVYDTETIPDGPGSLDDIDGESALGTWRLRVRDLAITDVGTLNSWMLRLEAPAQWECTTPGCSVTATLDAAPPVVCDGGSTVLSGAGSAEVGDDCSGIPEYRFEEGPVLLRDWSASPQIVQSPIAPTTYTLRVRDAVTLDQDSRDRVVDVVPPPIPEMTQTPDPACVEIGPVVLDAGTGFAAYQWRDAAGAPVATTSSISLDPSACGRTYSVQVIDGFGCEGTAQHSVSCVPCAPAEVSGAASPTPFVLGLDPAESIEFELLPEAGLRYSLYVATTREEVLAGDWTHKFCDLEANPYGSWTVPAPGRARWTPVEPSVLLPGFWVVLAEDPVLDLEGSYGTDSNGTERLHDLDRTGSGGDAGCP